ncbi:MAG: hypothetical protein F2942_05595 [Actinobacteria bacterium]|nr:hypothetical protein [Actinomycetota bacterium]
MHLTGTTPTVWSREEVGCERLPGVDRGGDGHLVPEPTGVPVVVALLCFDASTNNGSA